MAPSDFPDELDADTAAIYGHDRGPLRRLVDRVFRKSMRLRLEATLAGCAPLAGHTVLHVGCWTGHTTVRLAEAGAERVVGLDPAPDALEAAMALAESRGVHDRCEFLLTTLQELETDEVFDYCVVLGVMDYVADPRGFLEHVKRVTRKRAFLSFARDAGVLAAQRRLRRFRTQLHMHERASLQRMLDEVVPGAWRLRELDRDYFVELSLD